MLLSGEEKKVERSENIYKKKNTHKIFYSKSFLYMWKALNGYWEAAAAAAVAAKKGVILLLFLLSSISLTFSHFMCVCVCVKSFRKKRKKIPSREEIHNNSSRSSITSNTSSSSSISSIESSSFLEFP